MNAAVEIERRKYVSAYSDPNYSRNQGMRLMKQFPGVIPTGFKSLLDIGCGDGKFTQYWKDQGVDAWGIDFVDARAPGSTFQFVRASLYGETFPLTEPGSAYEVLLPAERFDFAVCLDVMEHIPEPFVDEVLTNIGPLSNMTLFNIANYPSVFSKHEGPLHVTLHDDGWWYNKLAEHGTPELLENHRNGVREYMFRFTPRKGEV